MNSALLQGRSDVATRPLVILVDDDPQSLRSTRRILEGEPYTLLTTGSPAEALQWVRENVVQALITEQVIQEKFGTELLKEVRKYSPATKCAIFTKYPEGGRLLSMLGRGDTPVIAKPCEGDKLQRTIRTLLYEYEMTQTQSVQSTSGSPDYRGT